MVLLGALTWVAFHFLGIPDALLLAILARLFSFIPCLGALAAAVPIVLMVLALGGALFGVPGIALATPLTVVIKEALAQVHVE